MLYEKGDEVFARSRASDRGVQDATLDLSRVGKTYPLQLREFECVPDDRDLGELGLALDVRRIGLDGITLRLETGMTSIFLEELLIRVGQVFDTVLDGCAVHFRQPTEFLLEHGKVFRAGIIRQSLAGRFMGRVPFRQEMVEHEPGTADRLGDQDLLFLGRIDPEFIALVLHHVTVTTFEDILPEEKAGDSSPTFT